MLVTANSAVQICFPRLKLWFHNPVWKRGPKAGWERASILIWAHFPLLICVRGFVFFWILASYFCDSWDSSCTQTYFNCCDHFVPKMCGESNLKTFASAISFTLPCLTVEFLFYIVPGKLRVPRSMFLAAYSWMLFICSVVVFIKMDLPRETIGKDMRWVYFWSMELLHFAFSLRCSKKRTCGPGNKMTLCSMC